MTLRLDEHRVGRDASSSLASCNAPGWRIASAGPPFVDMEVPWVWYVHAVACQPFSSSLADGDFRVGTQGLLILDYHSVADLKIFKIWTIQR